MAFPRLTRSFRQNKYITPFISRESLQNSRGGRVVLKDIPRPEKDEWGSPLDAMKAALELEKTVNQSIIDLHGLAGVKEDGNMTDFLEGFLEEQVGCCCGCCCCCYCPTFRRFFSP